MIDKAKYDYKISAAGRVNIIGEHIDYCGGNVFPAALSLCNTIYIKKNGTNKINLSWSTLTDKVTLDIDDLEASKRLKYGNYQAGSALMWKRAGHKLIGCDMLYDCTVPFGSGLSSSAAIEVSTIVALATIANEEIDPKEIALLAQKAEIEFVGVNCGIMDQYASACGKKDYAMLLNCKDVTCEYIPFDLKDYSLVIIDCKKPHSLIESKYNERRAETDRALAILQRNLPINCLAELSIKHLEEHKSLLDSIIYNRVKHVVLECDRVNKAKVAMKNGDIKALGKLLNESHASLKDLYEVTGIELDTLVDLALSHKACVGSRMTGGGFGGCTISLVKTDEVEGFRKYVCNNYKNKIGYNAVCYEASIADGIIIEKINKEVQI